MLGCRERRNDTYRSTGIVPHYLDLDYEHNLNDVDPHAHDHDGANKPPGTA